MNQEFVESQTPVLVNAKSGLLKIIGLATLLILTAVGLYVGWRTFWFLTDDAHITFRYVSNSILGYGYTWNAPPFRPVEGYTSFLWVVVLDLVWRLLGLEPPQAANTISLLFSYLTLLLGVFMLWRMKLPAAWQRWRLVLMALILLGVLTNRTFLAWTSSGLETAMFNFFFTLWITCGLCLPVYSRKWLAGMSAAAALTYLTRPDGIVLIACTLVLAAAMFYARSTRRKIAWLDFAALMPLVAFPIHMLWRYRTYDAWLPNTFYAKTIADRSMLSSGAKYLLSFIIEYALWIWLGVALLAVAVYVLRHFHRRREQPQARQTLKSVIMAPDEPLYGAGQKGTDGAGVSITSILGCGVLLVVLFALLAVWREQAQYVVLAAASLLVGLALLYLELTLTQWIVCVAAWTSFAYYTFVIGGDHFEFRVYSYLVLLLYLSFVWLLARLKLRPGSAVVALALFIALSWPIPWMHWSKSHVLTDRTSTFMLKISLADAWRQQLPGLPQPLLAYLAWYDRMQFDLIDHFTGMRHQEHKVYYELLSSMYPSRAEGMKQPVEDYPVFLSGSVGVQAWVMPRMNIIDELGLNDYVIARNAEVSADGRMAHERRAPAGYEECFRSNVVDEDGKITIQPRPKPFNAADIIACEIQYAAVVGGNYPASLQQRMSGQP